MSKDKIKKFVGQEEKEFTQSRSYELTDLAKKQITVSFTNEKISTDGGLLLLREIENQIGIIRKISECIEDQRHKSYVEHSIYQLLSQRVFQIAAGYEDANDCNQLRDDPIIKMCAGQKPCEEHSLASQPTMSRFENNVGIKTLYQIAEKIAESFIDSYPDEPKIIVIDCDDTNYITYGGQQLSLFNNYYDDYCYMPLHIYEGLSGKLITSILKPGRRSKSANIFSILRRLIVFLRKRWKNTIILVRGDSHFCSQELMDWVKELKNVHFVTGLTGNQVLNKLSAVTVKSAEEKFKKTQIPVKMYHTFEYKAESWKNKQRVIVKVEVNSQGTNIRYIVTDLRECKTKTLYEHVYCARGSMELRIKDHKLYLKSSRMSCNSFWANQMRLFMHSVAYIIIHTLQKEILKMTEFCNSTMETIRLKIIKIATRVTEMKTKIKVEFPIDFPQKHIFEKSLELFRILRC
jgi:hypothetical protein